MSLLLLLTGYPQGGTGIPPEPEPEPEPAATGGLGPGGAGRRRYRVPEVGNMIVQSHHVEEEEIFILLL